MTILSILGAHEFGHYLTCRHYGVSASLPYFIPAPIILTGTLGAFIRIRGPIQTKPILFDIGVAGPLAGFVVAVPTLVVGLSLSRLTPLPADFSGLSLGEPLLFQFTSWLIFGTVPEGYSVNLHPMAFAAWFGLLATALNLFPIGQLDGGHLTYAVFGKRSTLITLSMLCITVLLTLWSRSWIVWTILLTGMLIAFGPRHPPTLDEDLPLDQRRRAVAFAAFLILILCFTPTPLEPLDLMEHP
jgi:membrane-associated protease RseP (regulator of RpoE activity)